MTDELEGRLRRHLADRAAAVHAEPDPSAFVDHSVGPARRPGRLAAGVAALTVLVGGAGVLAGVNLAGTGAAAPAPTTTTLPGRAGAALAPAGEGASVTPSIAFPAYSPLFTRSTGSGVTIRAYSAESSTGGGCPGVVDCPPTTTVPGSPVSTAPCPADVLCAGPEVTPHTTSGPVSGSGTGGSTGSTPAVVPASCGQLVVELSTDRAVGTGSAVMPTAAATGDTLQVLGTGSFGVAEGAPVSWVAVSAGSGVSSVQLTVNGTVVDAMTPDGGVVVLALPGASGLAAGSVVGLDPVGSTVATVPAQQAQLPTGADSCATTPVTAPPTPSTTVPSTTTVPSATTTTGPGVAVPGPDLPAPASPSGTAAGG